MAPPLLSCSPIPVSSSLSHPLQTYESKFSYKRNMKWVNVKEPNG